MAPAAPPPAAADEAPPERPGSGELQPEGPEGPGRRGAGVEAAPPAVKPFTFVEGELLRFLLWHGCLGRLQAGTDEEAEGPEGRRRWEVGQADYLGKDAFRNIQKMLDRFLDEAEPRDSGQHTAPAGEDPFSKA